MSYPARAEGLGKYDKQNRIYQMLWHNATVIKYTRGKKMFKVFAKTQLHRPHTGIGIKDQEKKNTWRKKQEHKNKIN